MLILGIETTCDETSVAVVEDGYKILSNIIASQETLHSEFGGVVPEIACRAHMESIITVIDRAVSSAGISFSDIGAIAVANSPGLVGAILIGLTAAKSLAMSWDIPLISISHIQAHLYSVNLCNEKVSYPLTGLIVSGGHTSLFFIEDELTYSLLGGTLDDAAGEAFDKVAKILGLGYPGGPKIDSISKDGDRNAVRFPRSYLSIGSLDFSFSGLKTAVLYHCYGVTGFVKNKGCTGLDTNIKSEKEIADIAASFQEAVIDVLVDKTISAFKLNSCTANKRSSKGIVIGGGVARNSRLQARLKEKVEEMAVPLYYPTPVLCTDNAAMIAGLAYHKFVRNDFATLSLEAIPSYTL